MSLKYFQTNFTVTFLQPIDLLLHGVALSSSLSSAFSCISWNLNNANWSMPSCSTRCHDLVGKHVVELIWSLRGAASFQDSSSGWRWRPLSACCGECVKATQSWATQKWTRASPISTPWDKLWKSYFLCFMSASPADILRLLNCVISGGNKQKRCVSHLLLGRSNWT